MYYDYPQVFVGSDEAGQYYCCMIITENTAGPVYLCTPISACRKFALVTGELDLRGVFESPETKTFFHGKFAATGDEFMQLIAQDFSVCRESDLPGEGVFFDESMEDPGFADWRSRLLN